MKHHWFSVFFLLCISTCVVASGLDDGSRVKYNFNSDWRVYTGDLEGASTSVFDDSNWKRVTLPYCWNEDEAFKKPIHELSTGIAWYRKHFRIERKYSQKKVFLEFEGIRQAGEFYLNGTFIGRHENGAMAFGFDVSNLISFENENVIAVRIGNDWDYKEKSSGTKFQWNDRNFNVNYGGINKNTYLHITDKLHQTLPCYSTLGTTGVYVYPADINIQNRRATIHAESQVRNDDQKQVTVQYEVQLIDMEGNTLKTFHGDNLVLLPQETKTFRASALVDQLNFWSVGYGYLYTVRTILKVKNKPVDVVVTQTGFRKTAFQDGMVYLNDRVIQIKGYAQRTSNEWPGIGVSIPPWLSDYSNTLMLESNANTVRWMHITPSRQDVMSCDRVGLMQAMPAGDSERDVTDHRWEMRIALMKDAIIYNRNNPSIVFYECGNESISEEHMQQMLDIRNTYDLHGGRAMGSREMLDSKVAEYGGEMLYINKSADIPMWAMEYSRDEGLRKYWDNYSPPYHRDGDGPMYKNQNASVYNRNQDSHAIENIIRWYDYWEARPGTGKRVSSGGVNIIFSDTNTHFRGAENYRRSGEVDAMRLPKDGFFTHQVMWDGWVDPEKYRAHIIGHWNYQSETEKDVYVVSNADQVEMFLNGVSLGIGEKSYSFLHTFKKVKWQNGELIARAFDKSGSKVAEASRKTAGKPEQIRLTAHTSPTGFKADGADVALIDVEVVDANGNRVPTEMDTIQFTLEGNAEWRGGIAQGPDNYILSKTLPVECGVNRVIIRSGVSAGNIKVTAAAKNLSSASVSLVTIPVKVNQGLSLMLPYAALPLNLKSGPTSLKPSYKISRNAITIVNATAGSNSETISNSFDDDELTSWNNDGELKNSWVVYEFDKTSNVSQVCLKVADFRSVRYPVRISVDDKEVFNGFTQTSLGYTTITFPYVSGKSLRIELKGSTASKDGFSSIVEVTGKKDVSVSDTANHKLVITEIEVLEQYINK